MKKVIPTAFPLDPEVLSPSHLGAAIKAARTATKMTLIEAALSLGIAKQTLADLERGKPTVSLGIALTCARELGVTIYVVPSGSRQLLRNLIMDSKNYQPF